MAGIAIAVALGVALEVLIWRALCGRRSDSGGAGRLRC